MASSAYRSDDPNAPLRLAVLGDSTAYTGPNGPLLPDEPGLYPSVAARRIREAMGRDVSLNVLAHPGSGVRDSWYGVTKERHTMFEVLMHADAVVVGIGSFDHAPAGVPPLVEALMPFLRPAAFRRRVRSSLRAVHPWGVRLTQGRFARVGAAEFERLYDAVLFHVRALTWGVPTVALGPTSHRSPYYGHIHPDHPARQSLQRRVAERNGIPAMDVWPLVEPFAEKLNSDGIHWPFEAHEAVGEAAAVLLLAQIRGEIPTPSMPPMGQSPPGAPGPGKR